MALTDSLVNSPKPALSNRNEKTNTWKALFLLLAVISAQLVSLTPFFTGNADAAVAQIPVDKCKSLPGATVLKDFSHSSYFDREKSTCNVPGNVVQIPTYECEALPWAKVVLDHRKSAYFDRELSTCQIPDDYVQTAAKNCLSILWAHLVLDYSNKPHLDEDRSTCYIPRKKVVKLWAI